MSLLFVLIFQPMLSFSLTSEAILDQQGLQIFSENTLLEKLLKKEVDFIEFQEPRSNKTIHRLQVIYDGNLPIAFRLGNKDFSLKKYLERPEEAQRSLDQRKKAFINSIDKIMSDIKGFVQNERQARLSQQDLSSKNLYILEWSNRGLAVLSDATGVLLVGLSAFSPLPFTGILVLKFLARPIANVSANFYQKSADYYFQRTQSNRALTKPFTFTMFRIYDRLERAFWYYTKRTGIYLNNKALQIYSPNMVCRRLFSF